MNHSIIYNVRSLVNVVAVCLLFGCTKFVEVPPPSNSLTSGNLFSDSSNVDAALTGIYSSMTQGPSLFDGRLSVLGGLLADELTTSTASLNEFQTNTVSPNNSDVNNLWVNAYKSIYYANAIITGVQLSNSVSTAVKSKALAEARFIRGWWYYYLVNLYGDVPLIQTSDYIASSQIARTAKSELVNALIEDLKFAQANLPPIYLNNERTRPNQSVASAILSRVYLWTKDWSNAESEASKVIATNMYSPLPGPSASFIKTSKEIIWQIPTVNPSYNALDGNSFIPSNATTIPIYTITGSLYNSFETGDLRRSTWIGTNTISGNTYHYPAKYKLRIGSTTTSPTEYNILIRAAEIYLNRAEARIQQNNISAGIADINIVRTRAGLPELLTTMSKEDALLALEKERRVEFFAERGHRWFDLIRTQRADPLLSVYKGASWSSNDTLLPIPATELVSNPFLTQNTSY